MTLRQYEGANAMLHTGRPDTLFNSQLKLIQACDCFWIRFFQKQDFVLRTAIIWSPGQNMRLKAFVQGAYFKKNNTHIGGIGGTHMGAALPPPVARWAEDSPFHFPEASDEKITGKWLQVPDRVWTTFFDLYFPFFGDAALWGKLHVRQLCRL